MAEKIKPIVFKVLLAGDSQVGKSCLLSQYLDNKFTIAYEPTIGVEFGAKFVENNHKLQIWDTAGQESFRSITRSYYRGCKAIIIVFDLSNLASFQNLEYWIKEAQEYQVLKVLVGNKSDLERAVSMDEAEKFAQQYSLLYFETSAKNSVDHVFNSIAQELIENPDEPYHPRQQQVPKVPENQSQDEEQKVKETQADSQTQQDPIVYKLVINGAQETGKTSIMLRYADSTFSETYLPTIGVDFKIKMLDNKNNQEIKLQIWDTAGQERYQSITNSYFKGCTGIIHVFNIDNRQSFENLKNFDMNLLTKADPKCVRILVGNKVDLAGNRQVDSSEAQNFAQENGIYSYIEVSAKSGENIEKIFNTIVEGICGGEPISQVKKEVKVQNVQKVNPSKLSLEQQLKQVQEELKQANLDKDKLLQDNEKFLNNLNFLIEKLTKFEISAQEFADQVYQI